MRAFLLPLLTLVIVGCSSAETSPEAATETADSATSEETTSSSDTATSGATFSEVYKRVLSGGCANGYCHGGVAGGWSVKDEAGTYAELVGPSSSQCSGLKRVEPGAPEKSALYLKVRGDFATTCRGKRMPTSGTLSAEDLELVRSWIAGGAGR